MNLLVEKLRGKLIPEFTKIADDINGTFPLVLAEVEDNEIGNATEQGHYFAISLMIGNSLSEVDNVCLDVSLWHLTTNPKIAAGVIWGHPSGYLEAEFSEKPVEVSDQILEDLYKDLPRLYEALFEALKRRKPAS